MIRKDVLPDAWKGIDYTQFKEDEMYRPSEGDSVREVVCSCNIPDLDTQRRTIVNGYGNGLSVKVNDGEIVEKPLQIQSVVAMDRRTLIELHNRIEIGKNAQVKIIHCDDTVGDTASRSRNTTEISIGEGAVVEYYKLQNINNQSGLINSTTITMAAGAQLKTACITLNGGHICNHYEVRMTGEGCNLNADGLYLIDGDQKCDNYIFVEHAFPNCTSNELYKGILDDRARASFNGHVLVQDGAYKTEAVQNNRNILLTDKAHVETKPFLEIYNDDVKCAHGSAVGQLDDKAMFYMRTRGITERTARTMLAYAFCDEVIRNIGIEPLRRAISDMVKKRLHGELRPCDGCALQCSTPCNGSEVHFAIDPSKL